ncbi:MAG: CoA transferase, partial [Pseudomonadota bacterium]
MLPLEGVRVLAVEQYGAGPFGTMFLADQGAEVIKIENPADGGDMARTVGPHFFGPGDSQFFHSFNRNKKSVTIDLGQDEGRAVLHDLVGSADALACNLRGDVPAKLGLTFDQLRAHNPKIVCAHLTAYGRDGPRADWPGFDYMMQAEAGYFSVTGEPEGPPARFGLSVVDMMTGLAMAYGLLAGLTAARTTGQGRDVDVSLFDVALHNTSYLATWYLNEGVNQGRLPRSAHPSLTPCQLYPTADGWIFIMCNKEKFWPALCRALGRP